MSQSREKKKVNMSRAWAEARALMWEHRRSLAIGFSLMLVSRLAGLVAPASSKYLIDNVLTPRKPDLLLPLALAVGAATLLQAVTSFALSRW
jgi:subfamily B ATP-binding cassette protein MsbA